MSLAQVLKLQTFRTSRQPKSANDCTEYYLLLLHIEVRYPCQPIAMASGNTTKRLAKKSWPRDEYAFIERNFQPNAVLRSVRVRHFVKNKHLTFSRKLATLKRRMVGSLVTCKTTKSRKNVGDSHVAQTSWSRRGELKNLGMKTADVRNNDRRRYKGVRSSHDNALMITTT